MLAVIDEQGPRIVSPERVAELPDEQAARSFGFDEAFRWLIKRGRKREETA